MEKYKKGQEITFSVGNEKIVATCFGRYDFLYCFDTNFKTLPKVATVNNSSVVIMNLELLSRYGFTTDEVKAILEHELGHQISSKQDELKGMEAEFDADDYAINKTDRKTVISALEKTKILVEREASNEEKMKKSLGEIQERIDNVNKRKENIGEDIGL